MLRTYFKQINCALWISLSFDNSVVMQVSELIQQWNTMPSLSPKFIIRPCKLSQFEHYNLLLEENKTDWETKWILFTDDDDLWADDRIEKFRDCIHHGNSENNVL